VSKAFQYLLLDKNFDFGQEVTFFDFNAHIRSMFEYVGSYSDLKKLVKMDKLATSLENKFKVKLRSEKTKAVSEEHSEWFLILKEVYEGVRTVLKN
jgi:hypothetical protein